MILRRASIFLVLLAAAGSAFAQRLPTSTEQSPPAAGSADSDLQASTPQASADLPPVMEFLDGTTVRDAGDWQRRREEIRKLWCDTYLGHFPEEPPELLASRTLKEEPTAGGWVSRDVELTFATPGRARFQIRLWLPAGAAAPRPLLLTQPRHYQIGWAEEAVRRGYVVCFYPGVDYNHHEKDFPGYEDVWKVFKNEYPQASWSSSLAIQAWLAGRALDHLLAPDAGYQIDAGKVGIIGHSRYGKQSLYAAAFDTRITAVVARSAGSPAAAGYRFTGRDTFMETVRDFPDEWALGSLKDYYGRENALPVESNGLIALIAPRACLLHTAHNDGSDPTFAVERSYLSAREAYRFIGAGPKLSLQYRSGNHDPITADHVRMNLDWFDLAFGRGGVDRSEFREVLLHDFDWQLWEQHQRATDLAAPADAGLEARIRWALGEAPAAEQPQLTLRDEGSPGVAKSSRDRWKPAGVKRIRVSFGENVQGNLMVPENVGDRPLPVVIWLHPYNYSHGSNEGYGVEGTTIYYRLAQEGVAVLAYDQLGFGDRLLEGAGFYQRHPHWSKLGAMVRDAHDAVSFLNGGRGIADGEFPALDPRKVFLLGYSLGGQVALHAAALDVRVAGVASFCGFTPMRSDSDKRPTGGIRRLWEWHALQPKLGLFDGREAEIPYDYDEILAGLAPRPSLIYAAEHDRHATFSDVEACAANAKNEGLTFIAADDVNRFQSAQHAVFLEWLRRAMR